jgi:uncharacterized repeat protein (TIGR03803 family)
MSSPKVRPLCILLLLALLAVSQSGPAQTYTVLYSFAGGTDGGAPRAALIRDSAGNLYGTTASGGPYNFGTVFKLDATGQESVLHQFTGGVDGSPARRLDPRFCR